MRTVAGTPVALLLVGAAGYGVAQLAGWDVSPAPMVTAGAIVAVASAAAIVPLYLARRAEQSTAAQVGLVATALHMLVAIGLAGVVILTREPAMAFTYWLIAFYLATLILVAADAIRLVKSAPVAHTASRP